MDSFEPMGVAVLGMLDREQLIGLLIPSDGMWYCFAITLIQTILQQCIRMLIVHFAVPVIPSHKLQVIGVKYYI
jgi:hypothetical protein